MSASGDRDPNCMYSPKAVKAASVAPRASAVAQITPTRVGPSSDAAARRVLCARTSMGGKGISAAAAPTGSRVTARVTP